jgi:hypothetical protein
MESEDDQNLEDGRRHRAFRSIGPRRLYFDY